MNILVTGAAGFIGSRLAWQLAQRGNKVLGIDNINSYYNPNLKLARLHEMGFCIKNSWKRIEIVPEFGEGETSVIVAEMPWHVCFQSEKLKELSFVRVDLVDKKMLTKLFSERQFDYVVNLAAQAGVRYSIKNPLKYVESNIVGFLNILECSRSYGVKHLVYASSSSVYGMNKKVPFSENDEVISPVSIYAATKKSDELMAHVYSKLYKLPTTGLRYFTVYGPWGRPDMAPMIFARAISQGKPINVFNHGDLIRDFTYIDDIVQGTIQVLNHIPAASECPNNVPAKVYNIGCSNPVRLMDFIGLLEQNIGIESKKIYLPMQKGDVYQTFADTKKLEKEIGYKPTVQLPEGIKKFSQWYLSKKNPLK